MDAMILVSQGSTAFSHLDSGMNSLDGNVLTVEFFRGIPPTLMEEIQRMVAAYTPVPRLGLPASQCKHVGGVYSAKDLYADFAQGVTHFRIGRFSSNEDWIAFLEDKVVLATKSNRTTFRLVELTKQTFTNMWRQYGQRSSMARAKARIFQMIEDAAQLGMSVQEVSRREVQERLGWDGLTILPDSPVEETPT